MRKSFSAAVVAAAVTALFVPATAALAASTTVNDSKVDAWKVHWDKQNQIHGKSTDVTDNLDLTKVQVKYGKVFEMKTFYNDLNKDGVDVMPQAVIKTSKGGDPAYLIGSAYNDGEKWNFWGSLITGPQSGRVQPGVAPRGNACENAKVDVDWAADVFTVSVPSKCLGNPNWVKAHLSSSGSSYDADTNTYTQWVDNAHNKSFKDDGWTNKVKKG